jgi:hypothetical protein
MKTRIVHDEPDDDQPFDVEASPHEEADPPLSADAAPPVQTGESP